MAKILVVDDEAHVRKAIGTVLRKEGHEIEEAENGKEALERLEKTSGGFRLVLLDLNMPEMGGMELLKEIKARFPEILVLIITAYSTAETTMEAMSLGAYDYIVKPFDIANLKHIVGKAAEKDQLIAELHQLRQAVAGRYSEGMVGRSPQMQEIYKTVGKVAATPATVLIEGESGTGKELIARQIHYNSPRSAYPMVTVNCGAIPENLLESELFGHEKGAFTGAVERKPGKAELADRGTLFLDEVGELPLSLQVKLLRFLQEKEVQRVGGIHPVRVDVRVIAATNRNLQQMVEEGTFREDLYYRLNIVGIRLPSLRQRMEDVPDLVRHFLIRYAREMDSPVQYLAPETLERLLDYDWPGNIRQLQNVVCRSVVMASGTILLPEHLPPLGREERQAEGPVSPEFILKESFPPGFSVRDVLRRAEMQAMKWVLNRTSGNKAQAARLLDMSRKAFVYKCQEYGLDEEE